MPRCASRGSWGPNSWTLPGGAPELHPDIRDYVLRLTDAGWSVQVRTNLVSLLEPEAQGLAPLLAERRVRLLASLPSVLPAEVDAQRGRDVWARSLHALRMLGSLGYGAGDGLRLDLAVNPTEPGVLPRTVGDLDATFREALTDEGVEFDRLIVLTNVPVGRFGSALDRQRAGAQTYRRTLEERFNPATVPLLACRRTVVVAWDGTLWDCDFDLGAGIRPTEGSPRHVDEPDVAARLAGRRIAFGDHCFACTADAGSS